MKESDLYLPLKQFLKAQGYEVKGEVKQCDVLAVRGDEEPVIVELKLTINLSVILQAVDRLSLSSKIYIGIPKHYKIIKYRKRKIIKLLKMLGLGLIIIDPTVKVGCIDILFDPIEFQPRKSKPRLRKLLGEFFSREGDPNLGGSTTNKGRMTAYRQRATAIGFYLHKNGATKASLVSEQIQDPKAREILYKNHYGWFEKQSRGIYQLTADGKKEIIKSQAK